MNGYTLTSAAVDDVENIWTFTAENWGVRQAHKYVAHIKETCELLASGTAVSRPAMVGRNYRKTLVGSHCLYFRQEDGHIFVIRILHQTMDVDRHL